jgi:hypothetical protein
LLLNEKFGWLITNGEPAIEKMFNTELYRLNETSFFKSGNQIFPGIVRRADSSGHLIVEVAGIEKKFTTGSIEWIDGQKG